MHILYDISFALHILPVGDKSSRWGGGGGVAIDLDMGHRIYARRNATQSVLSNSSQNVTTWINNRRQLKILDADGNYW